MITNRWTNPEQLSCLLSELVHMWTYQQLVHLNYDVKLIAGCGSNKRSQFSDEGCQYQNATQGFASQVTLFTPCCCFTKRKKIVVGSRMEQYFKLRFITTIISCDYLPRHLYRKFNQCKC